MHRAEIDIKPSCMQMFKDIGHRSRRASPVYDGPSRTCRPASAHHLFGWRTFTQRRWSDQRPVGAGAGLVHVGVGDHMAHYHVNASVPKTLIAVSDRYVARTEQAGHAGKQGAAELLDTIISPETRARLRRRAGSEHRSRHRTLRAADFHL